MKHAIGVLTACWMLCALTAGPARAQNDDPPDEAAPGRATKIYKNYPHNYLKTPDSLDRWSVAAIFQNVQREVRIGALEQNIKIRRYVGQVGVNLFEWITIYMEGGSVQLSREFTSADDREKIEGTWSVGTQIRLLEHSFIHPMLIEDRVSIEADVSYSEFTSGFLGSELDWEEFTTRLTVSLINDVDGTRGYSPEEVRIFAGPIFSTIQGTYHTFGSPELSEVDDVGFAGGIDIMFTRHCSLIWAAEIYDSKVTQGLGVYFDF